MKHLLHHTFLPFCLLVTYLHSPFPLDVASHLPPFRHDSVGREHFRPVEHIQNMKTHNELTRQTACGKYVLLN